MKNLLIPFTLLALSTFARAQNEADAKVEALLEPYRDAVRALIDPWDEDQSKDGSELIMAAAKLADKHVLKLGKQLHTHAERLLKGEEQRKYDLDTYRERFEAEFSIFDLLSSSETGELGGMLVFKLWNPFTAAFQFRNQALISEVGASKVGLHFMRENIAPPEMFVISADPQLPVIAIESGKELTIAKLKYEKKGFYSLKSIRFLTKKEK